MNYKFTNHDHEVFERLQPGQKIMNPDTFKYLNALQAVWITQDFMGTYDLIWRWLNLELIEVEDVITFINLRRKTSACLLDNEVCAEELRVLDKLEKSLECLLDE